MAAYAEGLNILKHANVGKAGREVDAETTPLRHPEHHQYDMNLADITEVWRRGSVVASWLLDLQAIALGDGCGAPGVAPGVAGRLLQRGGGQYPYSADHDGSLIGFGFPGAPPSNNRRSRS